MLSGGVATDPRDWRTMGGAMLQPVAFGEDPRGEIDVSRYVNGSVWRLVPQ